MLWYLLSPIRGTTQPPRLSANHPVRRAFYRHGKTTAEHWLVAMLVSVAIAMAFSYPTIFLSGNPTTGLAAYPHHVWTTAKPYEGDPQNTDVEMRQIWIHGSYMKALDKDVLKSALAIQQTLVGSEGSTTAIPVMGEKVRSNRLSWGYHSPLMYWNNSAQRIDDDDDILRTINAQARSSSSLNVALRPASVFAGKKFDRQKLLAADALVITLIDNIDDGVGSKWREGMASLAPHTCKNCTLFPGDGQITRNRVYEFSFTPLSLQENALFTFAYSCMAIYVLLSLRRLKAFHSRFGLFVTVITQMTCSILASFTICSILNINLSMIPQNAYPFVVLVIGLENMFRIINAVLAYPATMATELRIANALGDVGPVSVATAAQNLIILSVLSRLVSPGVAAFCAFACIATLFDAFFLLTFFVAVLNVDIRRFELQDALARANQTKHRRRPSPPHNHTWFDALVQGRLPFSTRMAGTAVTTTFILSLNYHFFEHKEKTASLPRLLGLIREGPPAIDELDTFVPPPMNASLTPGQWMRMQDFDTAKEVMHLVKPGADTFVIRIFAPLIVVLSGADRTGMETAEAWSTALRGFAIHHFYPVAVAVVFAVAFVAVLMNFLLYSEVHDEPSLERQDEDELTMRSVALPHKLDIVKLSGSEKGHFVSVGLDRSIAIARFDRARQAHDVIQLPPEVLSMILWPIHRAAINDSGEWAACHCADDGVLVFSCKTDAPANKLVRYLDDHPSILFEFRRLPSAESSKPYFLMLTSGGRLTTTRVEDGETKTTELTDMPLLGAAVLETSGHGRRLVTVTDEAKMLCYSWNGEDWNHPNSQALPIQTDGGRLMGIVRIEQHNELGSDFITITTRKGSVFIDSATLTILGSLDNAEDHNLSSQLMLGPATKCDACRQLAFRYVALLGEANAGGECSITTLWARGQADAGICVTKETSSCLSFGNAQKTKHGLSKAGAWSAIASQAILGLRRPVAQQSDRGRKAAAAAAAASSSQLRHRRHPRSRMHASGDDDDDDEVWEAYKFSLDGEIETVDVAAQALPDQESDAALYVSNAGPAVSLDAQSVAVAFGNSVKVIRTTRRGSLTVRRPRQGGSYV